MPFWTRNRALTFDALCRWFETQTSKLFTGNSEFYVTLWVTKLGKKLDLELKPGSSGDPIPSDDAIFFCLICPIWLPIEARDIFRFFKSYSALWMPQKPFQLRVLALTSKKQPCDKCLLRILLPRARSLRFELQGDHFKAEFIYSKRKQTQTHWHIRTNLSLKT